MATAVRIMAKTMMTMRTASIRRTTKRRIRGFLIRLILSRSVMGRITVPTVKGTVGLSFVKRGGKTIYTIDVPEGTTGRFFATRYSSPRLLTGGRHVLTVGE